MNMLRILASIMLSVGVVVLTGCGSSTSAVVGDNHAYLYGKRSAGMRMQARVYHANEERSTLYFQLNTPDILYKSSGGGPFQAQVLVSYRAYSGWDMRELLDSASILVRDQSVRSDDDKELIGSLEMKGSGRQQFLVLVRARDLNRDVESTMVIPVDRSPQGRQWFLPMDGRGLPYFDDHVASGTTLRVLHERSPGQLLHAQHYPASSKLPVPVFASTAAGAEAMPDSTFVVEVGADGRFTYTAVREGMVHFRADTAQGKGYSVFSSSPSYPGINTAEAMVAPLRYITSTQEWDRIIRSTDPRKDVERFWLDAAGNKERAREAIKAYYGRVETANRFFTGEQEGWRTDRGLVHIIFGLPGTIRRSGDTETWIYGEETSLMSLVFTFVRRDGPFSGNDLVLRRDPQYKSAWYRNVESWRNGRVMQN